MSSQVLNGQWSCALVVVAAVVEVVVGLVVAVVVAVGSGNSGRWQC